MAFQNCLKIHHAIHQIIKTAFLTAVSKTAFSNVIIITTKIITIYVNDNIKMLMLIFSDNKQ